MAYLAPSLNLTSTSTLTIREHHGAWSSGNTLIPDSPPEFTEARDYFLREPSREEPSIHPAFRTRPAEPKTAPGMQSSP
ncbi:MAG: hypothetical protein EBS53_13010 [Bacteroidetes bacterium]|nr:hypothetical protein [Bacteroidota bacterium]